MGLVNQDEFTASNGITVANTYVRLGTSSVTFHVLNNFDNPTSYLASTDMLIYKDAQAYSTGCDPLQSQLVTYTVPDPSAVYDLLYGSAKASQGWGNTYQLSATATDDASENAA